MADNGSSQATSVWPLAKFCFEVKWDSAVMLFQEVSGIGVQMDTGDDLSYLAHEFELTCEATTNVVPYAAITALLRNDNALTQADLLQGISRERRKEGMMV